jgi:hypothetical protein
MITESIYIQPSYAETIQVLLSRLPVLSLESDQDKTNIKQGSIYIFIFISMYTSTNTLPFYQSQTHLMTRLATRMKTTYKTWK